MRYIFTLAALLSIKPALSDELPWLTPDGLAAYRDYQAAPTHKSFAIAPGGAWGWEAAADSPDLAEDKAMEACRATAGQNCTLYARNGQVVFDPRSWARLWGPYAPPTQAAKAGYGREAGKRCFDIAYRDRKSGV